MGFISSRALSKQNQGLTVLCHTAPAAADSRTRWERERELLVCTLCHCKGRKAQREAAKESHPSSQLEKSPQASYSVEGNQQAAE